jgi:hypothetical protein
VQSIHATAGGTGNAISRSPAKPSSTLTVPVFRLGVRACALCEESVVGITGHGEDARGACAMETVRSGEGVVFGSCGTAEERCLCCSLFRCAYGGACVVWWKLCGRSESRAKFKISHFLTAPHSIYEPPQSTRPKSRKPSESCQMSCRADKGSLQRTRVAEKMYLDSGKKKSSVMRIRTQLTSQMGFRCRQPQRSYSRRLPIIRSMNAE